MTIGLLLSATATLALPTDKGRSADVYTNAVRYFAARAENPQNWPSPRMRPDIAVAEAAPADETPAPVPLQAPSNIIAGAPADVIVAVAAQIAAAKTATPPAIIAETAPVISPVTSPILAAPTDGTITETGVMATGTPALADTLPEAPAAAASVPSLSEPFDRFTDTTQVSDAAGDIAATPGDTDAAEAEIAAIETPEPDLPEETVVAQTPPPVVDTPLGSVAYTGSSSHPDASTQAVSAVGFPDVAAPGSTRQVAVPDVDLVAVDDASADDDDLMAEMAEADANFVVRDGGEDGPDTMMMSSDVLFAFGSATLADDAVATLAAFGDMADEIAVLEVFGHTDAIGSESNNLRLGQERAEAVRDWLLSNTAFTEDRIIATGIGEVDPVAPNALDDGADNPEGRAQNRRVEFAFHEAGYTSAN